MISLVKFADITIQSLLPSIFCLATMSNLNIVRGMKWVIGRTIFVVEFAILSCE